MDVLSPFRAARRMACPGSHKLEVKYPQGQSTSALEGITAHWVAAQMLHENEYMPMSHHGIEITEEMLEGARLYEGFVRSKAAQVFPQIHIEEELNISAIHPNCKGTPDAWISNSDHIHIFDYKFGHKFVEVYENWQLLEYAVGVLCYLESFGYSKVTLVSLHVIQPRSFHPEGQIRSWTTNLNQLSEYANKLQNSEYASMEENPPTIVSPECNSCAARHACPALQTASMSSVDISGSAIPHDLNPTELSTELRFLEHSAELLEARISGLQAEALALIKRGERLPHHHAIQSRGRESWNKSIEEIIALGELMGITTSKPAVITPKQARSQGLDTRNYSATHYGQLKLMPLDTRKTDKIFGGEV